MLEDADLAGSQRYQPYAGRKVLIAADVTSRAGAAAHLRPSAD
ncbi:hypothetical protein L083_2921 [Actinoplanes sp. N902-109]|nr:hypothetical protein L083_2921 [Actinoplanes sp. N902-109]